MSVIKDETDIALLRVGGRRLALILNQIMATVRPGTTTGELDQLAHELIVGGGDQPAFLHYRPRGAIRDYPATLCVSINDEVVHGIPGSRRLKLGDIVSLDLGLNHEGRFTDMAVTVPVGKTTPAARCLIGATKEALRLAVGAARAGGHLGDIGHAVESFAKAAGYGVIRSLGGHAVGHAVHEEPLIPNFGQRGTGREIKSGMVLALEPMLTLGGAAVIYLPDGYTVRTADRSLAAHFEHTILVTDGVAEILTRV